jgi:hypothetical protein
LEIPFLDIYFCPFFDFQKTFAFSKSRFFSTFEEKKKCPKNKVFKEIPFRM